MSALQWTHCRACGWTLKTKWQITHGFHDKMEQEAFDREKEMVTRAALETFKLEGEPNYGKKNPR